MFQLQIAGVSLLSSTTMTRLQLLTIIFHDLFIYLQLKEDNRLVALKTETNSHTMVITQ